MKRTLPIGILLLIAAPSLAFTGPKKPLLAKIVPSITTEPSPRTMRSNHLFLSSTAIMHQASQRQRAVEDDDQHPVAKLARGVASALHAPTRFVMGIVITAIYISVVAFTSGCVRGSVAFLLARFPTWVSLSSAYSISKFCLLSPCCFHFIHQFRSVFQPFLILFFAPLYVMRTWASPRKRQERYALYRDIMNDAEWPDSEPDAIQQADTFAVSMEQ